MCVLCVCVLGTWILAIKKCNTVRLQSCNICFPTYLTLFLKQLNCFVILTQVCKNDLIWTCVLTLHLCKCKWSTTYLYLIVSVKISVINVRPWFCFLKANFYFCVVLLLCLLQEGQSACLKSVSVDEKVRNWWNKDTHGL